VVKGDRTRRALIEAAVLLIGEERTAPTSARTAARAGVSVRLVFHHFRGMEGLLVAAASRQSDRHRGILFAIPARGPPDLRIRALVRQRRLFFEAMAPTYRVAHDREHAVAGFERLLDDDRSVLRGQLEDTLAPEIGARAPEEAELLDALEQATGWDTWRSLRDDRHRSAPSAERVMAYAVGRLLA
jgi:AcrR family transcriptional regulator